MERALGAAMRRWAGGSLVFAAVVLATGRDAVAAARQDVIPSPVSPGVEYTVVKSDVVADPAQGLCVLELGGREVGGCRGGPPLTGSMRIAPDHPVGPQTLLCHGCRFAVDQAQIGTVVGHRPTSGVQLDGLDTVVPLRFARCCDDDLDGPRPGIALGTVVVVKPGTESTESTGDNLGQVDDRAARWWLATTILGLVLAALGTGLILWHWRASRPRGPPDEPLDAGRPRPVRVFLASAGAPGSPLPPDRPLLPDTPYVLAVDIGELTGGGPGTVPLAVVAFDSLTPTITGDLVRDVPLSRGAPGRTDFPLRTPPRSVRLRWRCGLYCRGYLLQSFVVWAHVGPPNGRGGWGVEQDYVTSFDLDPAMVARIERHELSAMINHDTPDEHGVYAYFDGERVAVTGYLPAGHVSALRERAESLYKKAGTASMDRREMARTLGSFALHGLGVLSAITKPVGDALRGRGIEPGPLWQKLAGQARAQVAWPRGSSCPLPATIIYDYPLKYVDSSRLELCEQFFTDLRQGVEPTCLSGRCVCSSRTVVCPAGFWGFRMLLSCQPSHGEAPVPDRNPTPTAPPTAVVGASTDPAFEQRDDHLTGLRKTLSEVTWYDERTGDALVDRLRTVQPSLIYLYCHGGVDPDQGAGYLEVGDGDLLTAPGLHWELSENAWDSRPLVLLNGCSTAALGDDVPHPLTPKLLWFGASGVVGTEIDITEGLACLFADVMVPLLLRDGRAVGDAVRAGRHALLNEGSPLGLAFAAFAPSDLRMIRS